MVMTHLLIISLLCEYLRREGKERDASNRALEIVVVGREADAESARSHLRAKRFRGI